MYNINDGDTQLTHSLLWDKVKKIFHHHLNIE